MYKEGKAAIKYTGKAFLNADALISRDVSAAYVAALARKGSRVLDCTAATGIRGIRYYLESRAKDVTLLEMNKGAFESMGKNVAFNRVDADIRNESVQEFTNATDRGFDFIDLDPFGGITPYIYDLMKVSRDGTRLMVTATDTAELCGADYRACMRLYDARPMHNELCQEVGLRLMIGYMARTAAQFNFGIDVEMSFSYLHYMRAFARLRHGSKNAADSLKEMGYVYYCNSCLDRRVERSFLPHARECESCGWPLDVSGRVWLGRLMDRGTVDAAVSKMGKYSSSESVEFARNLAAEASPPLFYSIPKLTKKMGIGSVSPNRVMELISRKGFEASKTHMDRNGIKTDADANFVRLCIEKSR